MVRSHLQSPARQGEVVKLGILASHPIQNQAPLFRALASRVELVVFYAHRQTAAGQAAAGFNVAFEWDVDLLAGYRSVFLENRAATPDTGKFFGCNTPAIAAHIKTGDFDAFLVTGWNLLSYWQAILACHRHGVPVMVRGDSHLLTARSPLKLKLKVIVYPWLLRAFAACLYVGQNNKQYLQRYGVTDERLFFAPHCIDNHAFAARANDANPQELRQQLGIRPGQKIVLYVGKLLPGKRVSDLLPAMQRLAVSGLDVVCLLVGDGPLRTVLEQQASVLGVSLRCAGFRNQSEMPAFYALADVLVLPSASETWGLVVNEALACGTPAVVSDSVGCGIDLVKESLSGAVFPVGDSEALALALARVLKGGWNAAAITRLTNTYSVDAAADGVLAAVTYVSGSARAKVL